MSGAEVDDKYLMIYYSDSLIQQWDLDTGEILRETRLRGSNTVSLMCMEF
ncbi:hypothetical protein MP638_003240 [Amoeboaphelidium occidentale]|nr:hypothetical protein MP638_003240 [Amoeboaphelidium occidentale]